MRALQVRQPLGVHMEMRRRSRAHGLSIQEFLSRLVGAELVRPLPERQLRRRRPPPAGSRLDSRVAQVYLPDDVHKAFKLRATEYGISQQDLLARLVRARLERRGVPKRTAVFTG